MEPEDEKMPPPPQSAKAKRSNQEDDGSKLAPSPKKLCATVAGASSNDAGFSNTKGAPNQTSVDGGIRKLNENLRSVLMSRTSFHQFIGFNFDLTGKSSEEANSYNEAFLEELFTEEELLSLNFRNDPPAGLLSEAAAKHNDEKDITKDMTVNLRDYCNKQSQDQFVAITKSEEKDLVVIDEGNLPAEESIKGTKPPSLDLTIGRRSKTKGESGQLLAFVEAGITKTKVKASETKSRNLDELMWKKIAQAMNYLRILFEENGSVWKKSENDGDTEVLTAKGAGTILFCVLVFTKDKTDGRVAVFSAVPRSKGFRVALLYRKEDSFKELDLCYGAFVTSVLNLDKLSKDDGDRWTYLGPDCTKVSTKEKTMVLRAYDNRVREAPRLPMVYETFPETASVVHVNEGDPDPESTINFGYVGDYEQRLSTLFSAGSRQNQVKVIAVPFHEGEHACRNIDQAISIVQWFKDFHDQGYVHGDIRGFNLVFSAAKSIPIDFDFGGRVRTVKYPPGYNCDLADGTRRDCHAGNEITQEADVRALKNVLFQRHKFKNIQKTDWWELVGTNETYRNACNTYEEATTMKDLLEKLKILREMFLEADNKVEDTTWSWAEMAPHEDYEAILQREKNQFPKVKTAAVQNGKTAGVLCTAAANNGNVKPMMTPFGAQYTPFVPVATGKLRAYESLNPSNAENQP